MNSIGMEVADEDACSGAGGVRPAAFDRGGRTDRARSGARLWCGSSPAASATRTSTPPPAPTHPAMPRPSSDTRAQGWSRRSVPSVESLAVGDHVVTLFSPQCRECVHCRDERTNLCLAIREQQNKGYLPDGTTRLRRNGEEIRHFMGTSTFAEYTVMPEIALAKVSPEAPLDRACLFACGLSTGLGAAINTAKVRDGSTCVVFGAGMVGFGAVAGCRLQGAERIICVDLSEDRLELARGQGATETMIGGEDTVERILERDRRLRRRLHLRGDGQRRGHAPSGRVRADGLGPGHRRRGRGQGRDPRHRPSPPDHRPTGGGLILWRRQGS